MADPLNPYLYRRLKELFRTVKISGAGEAMVARAVRDDEDRPQLFIEQDGEFYRVNCPWCDDTRYRLYINHMYGKEDSHGRLMKFLAFCFNENCMANPDNRKDLASRLGRTLLKEASIAEGIELPAEAREVLPPGDCIPLAALPADHHAVRYVAIERGFDPVELSQVFCVSYCRTAVRYGLASDRLIIPIYDGNKLKGWQARHIGELDWKGPLRRELPPKYFSCPGSDFRSKCLYNFEAAKKWETAIVVEGPTDVWRFGSMACCIFGNTLTPVQRRRIVAAFGKRTAVLLLDPEEFGSESTKALLEFMEQQMPGRFCAVKLPDGTDPGSLGRQFLKQYVKEEAARQGVKVVYRRVSL